MKTRTVCIVFFVCFFTAAPVIAESELSNRHVLTLNLGRALLWSIPKVFRHLEFQYQYALSPSWAVYSSAGGVPWSGYLYLTAGASLFPFRRAPEGMYLEAGFGMIWDLIINNGVYDPDNEYYVSGSIGYQFIFFKHFALNLGVEVPNVFSQPPLVQAVARASILYSLSVGVSF